MILARGGSKRVPRKNIRDLGGQPLVVWAFGAAKLSGVLDDIVVSSDDADILNLAKGYGLLALERPHELACDDASSYPAMLHALDSMELPYEYLCLLQPTSPFRLPVDVACCVTMAKENVMPAVVSVTRGQSRPNGAVYVGRTDWLRDGGNFDGPAVERYYMPPERSVDIDTEEDWELAESML